MLISRVERLRADGSSGTPQTFHPASSAPRRFHLREPQQSRSSFDRLCCFFSDLDDRNELGAVEVDLRDVGLDERLALARCSVAEGVSQIASEFVDRLPARVAAGIDACC